MDLFVHFSSAQPRDYCTLRWGEKVKQVWWFLHLFPCPSPSFLRGRRGEEVGQLASWLTKEEIKIMDSLRTEEPGARKELACTGVCQTGNNTGPDLLSIGRLPTTQRSVGVRFVPKGAALPPLSTATATIFVRSLRLETDARKFHEDCTPEAPLLPLFPVPFALWAHEASVEHCDTVCEQNAVLYIHAPGARLALVITRNKVQRV